MVVSNQDYGIDILDTIKQVSHDFAYQYPWIFLILLGVFFYFGHRANQRKEERERIEKEQKPYFPIDETNQKLWGILSGFILISFLLATPTPNNNIFLFFAFIDFLIVFWFFRTAKKANWFHIVVVVFENQFVRTQFSDFSIYSFSLDTDKFKSMGLADSESFCKLKMWKAGFYKFLANFAGLPLIVFLGYQFYKDNFTSTPIIFISLLVVFGIVTAYIFYDWARYLDNIRQQVAETTSAVDSHKFKKDLADSLTPEEESNTGGGIDDASFMTSEQIGAAGLLNNAGIPLGYTLEGNRPIHYGGGLHLITFAPNGTGKGACSQIPTLLEYDGSMFMIDPKGENAAVTAKSRRDLMGQEVHILNPFGVLKDTFTAAGFRSSCFNPLAALDPSGSNFVADVSTLCGALILTEGKDPYFDNSARDLVACLVMYVCTEENEIRTLPRVRQLLTEEPIKFQITLDLMSESDFPPLAQKAQVFIKDTKGNDAIISTARTQTSFLDDPCLSENLSYSDFSFLDLKREKITVYVVLPAKMVFTYSRWFRLLVTAGLDELMSNAEKAENPVLFMLDEAPVLGYLSCLETAFGLARGFGVQLWPFFQDYSQLERIYKDAAPSFLANAGIHQFFTPNDPSTAKLLQERCGDVTHTANSANYGQNMSFSESERRKPLYSAHNLRGMPDDEQLLFLAKHSSPIKAGRIPYFKNTRYNRKFMKNPYI